ncbi:MAG: class I SAM-dependent methyltransferase [Flavobacteriales bacterium]|nr:class I SAM-dependent methyltransferase [Flavobacteriales bacterium]
MQTLKAPVNTAFSGSIPQHYDSGLGPLFFEPFAQHLGERIAELAPANVLELACGTGRLTRHITHRLDPAARIVATDVNPAMLLFAQRAIADPRVEWNTVDAVALPYPDASFDLVVAQFGVMFYSDRVEAYREALRVLKPGGRLLITSWGRLEANPAARITQRVVSEFFPLDTPAFYTVPFAYHDRELIREEVLESGFERIKMGLAALTGHAATAIAAARGLLEGSPIHTAIMDRDPYALPAMREMLAANLAAEFGFAELQVPLSAWVVEAVKG